MYYVYLLISNNYPDQIYIGYTRDVSQRLKTHNNGGSPHTAKYKPWTLVAQFSFAKQSTALNFEKYLKSQSGRAFIKKRFL
ncbi:GIY-YIG nuclease family protein [Candidatus Dependentiae bacterium]|nr:MAG: GIY-YIG nuclease family protein [Candidatus Dependentiae bacterium]